MTVQAVEGLRTRLTSVPDHNHAKYASHSGARTGPKSAHHPLIEMMMILSLAGVVDDVHTTKRAAYRENPLLRCLFSFGKKRPLFLF